MSEDQELDLSADVQRRLDEVVQPLFEERQTLEEALRALDEEREKFADAIARIGRVIAASRPEVVVRQVQTKRRSKSATVSAEDREAVLALLRNTEGHQMAQSEMRRKLNWSTARMSATNNDLRASGEIRPLGNGQAGTPIYGLV